MNKFYQVERTDWDLRVPMVRWVYGAMHKNLSMGMILEAMRKVEAIALGRNPHAITPIIGTTHEDQSGESMQPREDEHMQI